MHKYFKLDQLDRAAVQQSSAVQDYIPKAPCHGKCKRFFLCLILSNESNLESYTQDMEGPGVEQGHCSRFYSLHLDNLAKVL